MGVDEMERTKLLAKSAARQGQLTQAEVLFREGLERASGDTELIGQLGIVLVAMNRTADAKPYLAEALQSDPENDRVAGALGLE